MNTEKEEGKPGQVLSYDNDTGKTTWVYNKPPHHWEFVWSLSRLQAEIHETAKRKGWWEGGERSPLEILMLIVSELSEACEEARKGTPPVYYVDEHGANQSTSQNFHAWRFPEDKKPEGELIELADAVIRILDYCGHKEWNLAEAMLLKMNYNEKRGYRHGGKKF